MAIAPTRVETQLPDGRWRIDVTPPRFMDLPTQSVELTADQAARYRAWLQGRVMIQDALPDLSRSQREVLMSGIGDEDWDRLFPDQ